MLVLCLNDFCLDLHIHLIGASCSKTKRTGTSDVWPYSNTKSTGTSAVWPYSKTKSTGTSAVWPTFQCKISNTRCKITALKAVIKVVFLLLDINHLQTIRSRNWISVQIYQYIKLWKGKQLSYLRHCASQIVPVFIISSNALSSRELVKKSLLNNMNHFTYRHFLSTD